jgi:hypothetical protein
MSMEGKMEGKNSQAEKQSFFFIFSPNFFLDSKKKFEALCLKNGGTGRRVADGAGEERVGSCGSNP